MSCCQRPGCIQSRKGYTTDLPFSPLSYNEYRIQIHDKKSRVYDTMINALSSGLGHISSCNANQCPHNFFKNQNIFLDCLWKYMMNDKVYLHILRNMNINSCEFKNGICTNCCHTMIIRTKGLNVLFLGIQMAVENSQFYNMINTNLILLQNPSFIKCILSKSNMNCLSKIFHLFFITLLEQTNLTQVRNCVLSLYVFEKALASVSTIIVNILPFMKSYHVEHIMLTIPRFNSLAFIINRFITKLCNFPHILMNRKLDKAVVATDCIQAFFRYVRKRHPLIKRFILIIEILYRKIDKYYKVTKKCSQLSNRNKTLQIAKKIRDDFRHFMKFKHFKSIGYVPRTTTVNQIKEDMGGVLTNPEIYKELLKLAALMNNSDVLNDDSFSIVDYMINAISSNSNIPQSIKSIYSSAKNTQRLHHTGTVYVSSDPDCIWTLAYIGTNETEISKALYGIPVFCAVCNKKANKKRFKKCSRCRFTYYCSRLCQKYDWKYNNHRTVCYGLYCFV
eukprot:447095_1